MATKEQLENMLEHKEKSLADSYEKQRRLKSRLVDSVRNSEYPMFRGEAPFEEVIQEIDNIFKSRRDEINKLYSKERELKFELMIKDQMVVLLKELLEKALTK